MEIITIILGIIILSIIIAFIIKLISEPIKEFFKYYIIQPIKKLFKISNQETIITEDNKEKPHISFYKDDNYKKEQIKKYESKSLLTKNEMYFYNVINENFKEYLIQPQVNLATIIEKHKDYPTQYQNELFRNIDIGIFDKHTMQCLLLIEINDKTHNQRNRIRRDIKVKEICEDAGINIITFHTKFENRPDYIVNRIKKEIKR